MIYIYIFVINIDDTLPDLLIFCVMIFNEVRKYLLKKKNKYEVRKIC